MSYEIFRFAKAINKLNDNLIELKKINININYTIFFPLILIMYDIIYILIIALG